NLGAPGTSPKFKLEFTKARGCNVRNWTDFQSVVIELKDEKWVGKPARNDEDLADRGYNRLFAILCEKANIDPPPGIDVPLGRKCLTEDELRQKFKEAEERLRPTASAGTIQKAYNRAMSRLLEIGSIGKDRGLVWDNTTTN